MKPRRNWWVKTRFLFFNMEEGWEFFKKKCFFVANWVHEFARKDVRYVRCTCVASLLKVKKESIRQVWWLPYTMDLELAADEMKNDLEVVMASLHGCGDDLLDDKEVILHCVSLRGRNLKFAADEMKNNLQVVMAAVSTDGNSLEHASESMKDNKDVVMAAIAGHDGQVLKFASKRLKGDVDVVRAAMTQSAPDKTPLPGEIIQFIDFDDGQLSREEQKEYLKLYINGNNFLPSIEHQVCHCFPEWAKDDKDIMGMCCAKEAKCIIHASDLLAANKEFIVQILVANPACADELSSSGKQSGYGKMSA